MIHFIMPATLDGSRGDFVVLRILATDADGATEGGAPVLAEDVDPCASRLLEEGTEVKEAWRIKG